MATQTTTKISAADGIKHAPSTDPSVHRALVVVDPPMSGRVVAERQRAGPARRGGRGFGVDGIVAEHFLGLRSATYLMRDVHGHRVVTEGAQRILRHPDERDDQQLARAKARQAHAKQSPAFFAKLAADLGLNGDGIADALKFAASVVGTRENPPMSNDGPKIRDWCHAAGYTDPVPWCGCFVNACLMAGGLPSGAGWIGYTPSILARAKAGTAGWSFHKTGMPGDLALYDDGAGGDPVVHVEIVRKRLSASTYSTYGGNTSSGNGSPSDGGMVARHDNRSTSGMFHIIGFARPPWKH
jgi:hypothetical protein